MAWTQPAALPEASGSRPGSGAQTCREVGSRLRVTAAAATAASQMTPGCVQLNGSGGDRRLMQGRVVARRLTEHAGSAAAGPAPRLFPSDGALRAAGISNQWSQNHHSTVRVRLERTACTTVCTADDAQPHMQMHLPRHLGWTAADQTAANALAITCESYYKQTRLQLMPRGSGALCGGHVHQARERGWNA